MRRRAGAAFLAIATLLATVGPAWRAVRATPATLPGFSDL